MSLSLHTDRLDLVPPTESHTDAYLALYGDEAATHFIPHTRVATRTAAWFKVAAHLGHWQLRGYGFWVVQRRDTGEVIGNLGLMYPAENPALEIGWLIAPMHQGKGYALEGTRAALAHAFDVIGADRVIARIDAGNTASQTLARRLRMVPDAALSTESLGVWQALRSAS
ncbi:GNAT family N-acetyltransferase [Chitinimonas sp. BJYL2]|uniref:GNAT family N-acetyltransferase n=1 Tax=Chitinimonas sp. BJYL2 TaxID=2976696 RepID=UPI0022B4018F|nr:GNAT family N-acetyltransferase [Chitinimonas sp. BJYL2]